MESALGFVSIITFIVSVIVLIVFFVMASNLGKCVVFLRGIYNELKVLNDPLKQKAKSFDASNAIK